MIQLEFEKEVYNLYLDYMDIEDNNISYRMFIWDVLYNELQKFNNIDELNIIEWNTDNITYYGLKHKTSSYSYYLYNIKNTTVQIDIYFQRWLTKLKTFILNINIEELDLTKCNKGDKLLMRNGEIVIFDKVDEETNTSYIIDAFFEKGHSCNFKKNGKYYNNDEHDRDIIKILN